jgi:hypothetical protein
MKKKAKIKAKLKIDAMKKLQKTLTFLTICLSTTLINAQAFNCADLSILGFGPDPFNSGNSNIHIHLAGDSMEMINYPYISLVTDCNGDTIATGSLSFFGQMGQTVQSYPVTGDITNACLPITIQFIYGNTNFLTDTCVLLLNSLPAALTCNDLIPIDIQVDQSNTLINISLLGTANTYISDPHISFVTDCSGDTIATGFINHSGQIGLSTHGYPITSLVNSVCYPITVEFIFGNTNFETDTCLLTLNATTGNSIYPSVENVISIFPNPATNEITIQTNKSMLGKNYLVYDYQGKLILTGKLISEKTFVDIDRFSNGLYLFRIDGLSGDIIKVLKH